MITELPTTIDMPDVCDDIDQAYFGKNKFGGDVAEIYAYRLVPRLRSCPDRIALFHDQDAFEAADNLAKLCKAYLVIHPDARFAYERHTARLFEDVDLESERPFPPFSHRIHLKVYPEPVENPKVVLLLTMVDPTKGSVQPITKYRLIIDPRDRPCTYVEYCDKDRLGAPKWLELREQRMINELFSRSMLALAEPGIKRWTEGDVVYIDLGQQTAHWE